MTGLSRRLQAVCDFVSPGLNVCDVGCDHGFVSIYLADKGICPGVLAMDVVEGPVETARLHVNQAHLSDKIEVRRSDGLNEFQIGEAESLIIAGMGGRLMLRLLLRDLAKTVSFKELILSPQSEIEEFRHSLWDRGFEFENEKLICEDGKFYWIFKVKPGNEPIKSTTEERRYGKILPNKSDETLKEYLLFEKRVYEGILTKVPGGSDRAKEVQELLDCTDGMINRYY